jgi:hypothetical protein
VELALRRREADREAAVMDAPKVVYCSDCGREAGAFVKSPPLCRRCRNKLRERERRRRRATAT